MTASTRESLIPLCPAEDVWEGAIKLALLPDRHRVALYQVDGQFFATDDTCTHGEASLSEDGSVEGHYVQCCWHNGSFDIRTGEARAMPCSQPIRTWPIHIVDGQVCLLESTIDQPADA